MAKKLFILTFIISFAFLHARWNAHDLIDRVMWSNQAEFVVVGDPEQFTFKKAYAHPGGTIIEATLLTKKITGFNYSDSLMLSVKLLLSFILACIVFLSYILRRNVLWSFAILMIFLLHWLFVYVTPPTVIASWLFVLVFMLSLYIYENNLKNGNNKIPLLMGWIIGVGFLLATRIDIGVISFLTFVWFVASSGKLKEFMLISLSVLGAFWIFDPFMWYMPMEHLQDLMVKFLYHYSEYAVSHLDGKSIFNILGFTMLAILSAGVVYIFRKRVIFPVPVKFFLATLVMTIFVLLVLLSSNYQAVRYFLPILFLWESLLTLFMFSLSEMLVGNGDYRKSFIEKLIVFSIISFHAFIFIYQIIYAVTIYDGFYYPIT